MSDPIVELRQHLHQHPELSGEESETASKICEFFSSLKPDAIVEKLGGHGVAAVFKGKRPGPTLLLRCDLDAVPIMESNNLDYCSTNPGVSHKCGHDGHMAIVAAVAMALSESRPERGKVVLLFQPAEENGQGAEAVISDPKFAELKPDFAFALHNLPGLPLGEIVIKQGTFSCASRGMTVRLSGTTAHAAQPETGRSPTEAMCQFIQRLSHLPQTIVPSEELGFATVVGANLGKKAFGTAPGYAEVWVTLRTETDNTMTALVDYAEQLIFNLAKENELDVEIDYEDIFNATVNSDIANDMVRKAAGENRIRESKQPFRWSEDFGRFTAISEGALFGIGAGVNTPALHDPEYDFPDELTPIARDIFLRLISQCLSE